MPDEDVITLDVGKHAPESGKGHYPTNGTTIPSEANDPYTLTNNEPGGGDTGMSNVATSSNPSLKAYSPFPRNTDIYGREYTFTTGATQAHRLEAQDRPERKPPDKS